MSRPSVSTRNGVLSKRSCGASTTCCRDSSRCVEDAIGWRGMSRLRSLVFRGSDSQVGPTGCGGSRRPAAARTRFQERVTPEAELVVEIALRPRLAVGRDTDAEAAVPHVLAHLAACLEVGPLTLPGLPATSFGCTASCRRMRPGGPVAPHVGARPRLRWRCRATLAHRWAIATAPRAGLLRRAAVGVPAWVHERIVVMARHARRLFRQHRRDSFLSRHDCGSIDRYSGAARPMQFSECRPMFAISHTQAQTQTQTRANERTNDKRSLMHAVDLAPEPSTRPDPCRARYTWRRVACLPYMLAACCPRILGCCALLSQSP